MVIDEIFNTYPNNIIGFRTNNNKKIIDFWLDDKWSLNSQEKAGVSIKKEKQYEGRAYYIIFSDVFSFEQLYNFLAMQFEYNLENEKKEKLFLEKRMDLENLFKTYQYEELKELFITIPAISPDLMKNNVVNVTEDVSDNVINSANEGVNEGLNEGANERANINTDDEEDDDIPSAYDGNIKPVFLEPTV
jgi:hypothetical protein